MWVKVRLIKVLVTFWLRIIKKIVYVQKNGAARRVLRKGGSSHPKNKYPILLLNLFLTT